MSRLEALSILLLICLPILSILVAINIRSFGFFVYSFPGVITPGLTSYIVSKKKT